MSYMSMPLSAVFSADYYSHYFHYSFKLGFCSTAFHGMYFVIVNILKVTALLRTLEQKQLAKHKGHFALFNFLVLGHTKHSGVQWVYSDPSPKETLHTTSQLLQDGPCLD